MDVNLLSHELSPARLYHFSEDPDIKRFHPHVPKSNADVQPLVWAIDSRYVPVYWFPRDCPRGTVWARNESEQATLTSRFHTTSSRLHVTELGWLTRMKQCMLYVYEFDAAPFRPWPDAYGYHVTDDSVVALSMQPVGDLLARHTDERIELRFVENVWPFWDQVTTSALPFSGVRLSNANARTS